MGALRDHGIEVPGDLAVVGFDDIAIAHYLSPALTTVRVDAYALGERAFRSLVAALQAPNRRRVRSHELLPATVVVRRSCGSTRPAAGARGGRRPSIEDSTRLAHRSPLRRRLR